MRAELILCFGWLHYQVVKRTRAQCSKTEFAVLATGWLMALYTLVSVPVALWVLLQ